MKKTVTIIDYGLGNLWSVAKAFEHCGACVRMADSPAAIERAEILVLPGVGAFLDGMNGLTSRGYDGPIKEFAQKGRPLLGICLGMQMMFERSEEFGNHEGLGLIPGSVRSIPSSGVDGQSHRVPVIGWNRLSKPKAAATWDGTVLSGVSETEFFYFAHSYAGVPENPACRLADYDYDGHAVCSVVARGPLVGCQFHPEKSGPSGIRVIRNFLTLSCGVAR